NHEPASDQPVTGQGAGEGVAGTGVRPKLLLGRQGGRDLRVRRFARSGLSDSVRERPGPIGSAPEGSTFHHESLAHRVSRPAPDSSIPRRVSRPRTGWAGPAPGEAGLYGGADAVRGAGAGTGWGE